MKNKLLASLLFLVCSLSWAASGNLESTSTGLLNRTEIKLGENSYCELQINCGCKQVEL